MSTFTRFFTEKPFRTLPLLLCSFCTFCFGVLPAHAASKVIADFSQETSPYVLNDGDDLMITTSTGPAAPFEIRIGGGIASIAYKPAGPSILGPQNLYITSQAAVTLTLKGLKFTPPADRSGIDLAGDSRLLLAQSDGAWNYVIGGVSRTAALIYVPRGRSLTIDSADEPGSAKGTLSVDYGAAGTFDAAEPAGMIRIDGGRMNLMTVQGDGLNFVFNRGYGSINTLAAAGTGAFTVNGGSLAVGTLTPSLLPMKNGQTLGYISFALSGATASADPVRFSIAGMPEYDAEYIGSPISYFLPTGNQTVTVTQGSRSVSYSFDISTSDTVERKRVQALDFSSGTQYPTLPPANSATHDRVTLPDPKADGSYNTVSAIMPSGYNLLLSATQSGTCLEAGKGKDVRLSYGSIAATGFILEKGQVEIAAGAGFTGGGVFPPRTLLLLRDGTPINAEDSGATIRARFDPQCTSTRVELVSGSLTASLPQNADGGDGCPANAITPPRGRYALQDGALACAPERLSLTGTYVGWPHVVNEPGGLSASYPVTLTAGQSVYIATLIPASVLGTAEAVWFHNSGANGWRAFSDAPFEPFHTAAQNETVTVEFLKNLPLAGFEGTEVYLGIGNGVDEMVAQRRYCGIMQLAPQK